MSVMPVIYAALQPVTSGAAEGAPAKLDPVQLVLHASLPVKIVLGILVFFSLLCWLVIGLKWLHMLRARGDSDRFLKAFDLATFDELAEGLAQFRGSPFARIFAVGYDEMRRVTGG